MHYQGTGNQYGNITVSQYGRHQNVEIMHTLEGIAERKIMKEHICFHTFY